MSTLTLEEKACNFDQMQHIHLVAKLLHRVATELLRRADEHDASKLESPEVEEFAKAKPLKGMTYGEKEFDEQKKALKVALDHHYSRNDHHPEFFKNGVDDMNMIQMLEMLVDWLASSKRHNDGNIRKSLEVNAKRFDIHPKVLKLLENTIPFLEGVKE